MGDYLDTSEGEGWSGGFCLATMAEAGWLRSSAINPVMALILANDVHSGVLPLVVASNSGGSMFAVRYFTLRYYPLATKWSYPCYLLADPFKEICYFHSEFGDIPYSCYFEFFNVVLTAGYMVYAPQISAYGGPMGVLAVYISVYFPYIADLPIAPKNKIWPAYCQKYILFNTRYSLPSNWLVAHTISSPIEASGGRDSFNYGYDSYLSRAAAAYDVKGEMWSVHMSNASLSITCAASANTQSGFLMFPFSLAGKSWDGITMSNALAPAMKLFSMVLSYVMIRRLMAAHSVMSDTLSYMCKNGCPIMDGSFTDNAPLTPIVASSAATTPTIRPTYILSIGAASTMVTVKYLMGAGPVGFWSLSGINACPFTVGGICTILSKIRELVVAGLPTFMEQDYFEIGNTFQIYMPEAQLITPFCGDPLTYDLFAGTCAAEGACDMMATVIPSTINNVPFTPEVYSIVFVMAYLQTTPVASRFVSSYLPQSMWSLEYYEHMDSWFPNFDALAPAKGGVAFTALAGNSFMDFMTYLNIRLNSYLVSTKLSAGLLAKGTPPKCSFSEYKLVEMMTDSQPAFLSHQAMAR